MPNSFDRTSLRSGRKNTMINKDWPYYIGGKRNAMV